MRTRPVEPAVTIIDCERPDDIDVAPELLAELIRGLRSELPRGHWLVKTDRWIDPDETDWPYPGEPTEAFPPCNGHPGVIYSMPEVEALPLGRFYEAREAFRAIDPGVSLSVRIERVVS